MAIMEHADYASFGYHVNNLFAVSYAGNKPPLSCFNDGIQISTGATIGQGLIKVSDQVLSIPTVDFEYNGRKIKLSLKTEFVSLVTLQRSSTRSFTSHTILSSASQTTS